MKRAFWVVFFLFITFPAFAKLPPIVGGLVPPKKYDHPYYDQYAPGKFRKGKLIVKSIQMERDHFGFMWAHYSESGICTIYVNRTLQANDKKAIIRHERAHCNGWDHD